ncbi:uncharacterized protein [Vulpes vulpes]|uniref:Immunoglobulin V-set domain-containing protein n=1 Tax=Vulpes vulpes TaxID=9627 RepID=A0ABM4ZKZ0_VULVU
MDTGSSPVITQPAPFSPQSPLGDLAARRKSILPRAGPVGVTSRDRRSGGGPGLPLCRGKPQGQEGGLWGRGPCTSPPSCGARPGPDAPGSCSCRAGRVRARVCREIPAEDREASAAAGTLGDRGWEPGTCRRGGGSGEPPPGPRDPAPPPEAAPRGGGRTRSCRAGPRGPSVCAAAAALPRAGRSGQRAPWSPPRPLPEQGAAPGGSSCWQSLLTFWNPPTTAQVTVESVPPNAAEGKDALLRVHNLPGDTAGLAWFRGEIVAPVHQIVLYVVDTGVITPGPAHSGREIIYPSGSLLFQNITLKDTGSYILQITKRNFQIEQVPGQLCIFWIQAFRGGPTHWRQTS